MRAVFGQTSQQFSGGLVRADFHGGLRQNRAGIHGTDDTEHGGARHLLPRPDGTLHRSGATPLGQQGEMQVVPTHRQRVEHVLFQDLAVRHHSGGLCAGGRKLGHERFLARIGFDDRQTEFERGLLDWIRHQFATSSGWRVRPGEHGHHFEMLGILGQ